MTEVSNPQVPSTADDQTPVVAPSLPYSFHATLSEFRKRVKAPMIVAVVIILLLSFRFGVVGFLIIFVSTAILLALILKVLSGRSARLSNEGVSLATPLFKQRSVAYGDIEGVKVFINYVDGMYAPVPRVSIAVKNSKKPITFNALYWRPEELDNLLAILRDKKIPTEYYADLANSAMIAKQFPSYASLIERHPWSIAWAVVFGIVIVITVAVIVFQAMR